MRIGDPGQMLYPAFRDGPFCLIGRERKNIALNFWCQIEEIQKSSQVRGVHAEFVCESGSCEPRSLIQPKTKFVGLFKHSLDRWRFRLLPAPLAAPNSLNLCGGQNQPNTLGAVDLTK